MAAIDAQASKNSDLALLIGRIVIGALFVIAAYNKAKGYGGSMAYFGRLGVPMPSISVPVIIAFEAIAGLMLIVGFQTRLAAIAIAVFCVAAALLAHTNIADGNQFNHLLKNFAIAGGCLALFVSGPGAMSVDAKRG